MAESDQVLLQHYNLNTLNPSEWPAVKDEDDSSDEDEEERPKVERASHKPYQHSQPSRTKSRYSGLQRVPGRRGSLLDVVAAKGDGGGHEYTQVDEPDPLGRNMSVVQALNSRGVQVEQDMKLRNRFLLSSNTFSPTLFLSEVHNNASTEELLYGLEFLSKSIEKKSASLKVLVGSNFERFVRAKATIDNVYTEMRKYGVEPEPERKHHSRHSSRMSAHFRKSSNNLGPVSPRLTDMSKKSALLKESEYGVQGIKSPLLDASVKAQEVWGPALGGQEREDRLRTALLSVEKNRAILQVEAVIDDAIKHRDYDIVAEEYARAHGYANDAKVIADKAKQYQTALTDLEVHQIVLTVRMWMGVDTKITEFKRHIWRDLSSAHFAKRDLQADGKQEEYMELLSILLQLGVEDNPIWVWLLSRYDYLKNTISRTCERTRVEIEVLRRRLYNGERPTSSILAKHLKTAHHTEQSLSGCDTPEVLQFWELIRTFLHSLLSLQGGLLGEVIEFWDTVQSFVNGKKQRSLPTGINGASRKHHRLSGDGIRDLQNGARDLFSLIRGHVYSFFTEPPVEDISALFSPPPVTPKTPGSVMISTPQPEHFNFGRDNLPPPSPRNGEKWDTFAFWPPHGNSLAGINYLSKIVNMVATAAGEVAALDLVKQDNRLVEEFKQLISTVRERSITIICATWLVDAENCRHLEDWTRSPEKLDQTNLPSYFNAFESTLLSGLQKTLYLSDAVSSPGAALVINPPSQRHVETVQKGLKHSLYKAFSGMMEHAAKPTQSDGSALDQDPSDITIPASKERGVTPQSKKFDATNVNVRKLLTMSNFQALRSEVVPGLVTQFETNFMMTISEDLKQARDVLMQMNARVFQSYVRPTVEHMKTIISTGIGSPSWTVESARPVDARPYVYEVLLKMVIVHTEISNTAPSLTSPVLSHMLDHASNALIDAFKQRSRYTLTALMQATLDVEFLAQTLNNYTTEKASETQSQIYLALDERTDNDARMKLQNELPEMRAILKKLKENTKSEFACFKRQRSNRDKGDRRSEK